MTHLDYHWASPVWAHWWRALSEGQMLGRYDERGCGLSDWSVDPSSFTLDAWVHDLETVVETGSSAGPPRQRTHTDSGAPSATSTPTKLPAALTYRP